MGYIFVTREHEWNGLNVIDGLTELTELTVITGLTATLSFSSFCPLVMSSFSFFPVILSVAKDLLAVYIYSIKIYRTSSNF